MSDVSPEVGAILFTIGLILLLVTAAVKLGGKDKSSKIEHFNIMCANELGPTFFMGEAKTYDLVGNIILAKASNGNDVTYVIPSDVYCIVDPVTTEELNQQGAMPNGNDRLPEQNL